MVSFTHSSLRRAQNLPQPVAGSATSQLELLRDALANNERLCHPTGAQAIGPWCSGFAVFRLRLRSACVGHRALSVDKFVDVVLATLLENGKALPDIILKSASWALLLFGICTQCEFPVCRFSASTYKNCEIRPSFMSPHVDSSWPSDFSEYAGSWPPSIRHSRDASRICVRFAANVRHEVFVLFRNHKLGRQ